MDRRMGIAVSDFPATNPQAQGGPESGPAPVRPERCPQMMRWIVGSSLKLPLLAITVAIAVVYAGLTQLRQMPVDILPEFSPVYVEIQTEALGLSAVEVEQLITAPMEQTMLNGVAWLDSIHSESVPGLSSIVLVFEPGTDPLRARQMVQERLARGRDLPKVSKPPVMLQPLSSTSRVLMIRLDSKDLTPIELSMLARWTVKPALMGVPGVANVAIWGQRERQLQVHVDPAKLQAQGVTLNQVVSTSANALWVSPLSFVRASTPGTGGFIETPNQRMGIQHILPITSPDDLAQVTLEGSGGKALVVNGQPVKLGDVATVVEDHQPLIGDATAGSDQGLILVVEKFPEANALAVTRDLEATIDRLAPGMAGVDVNTTVFRPATFIEQAIDNLTSAAFIGLLLVVIVIGLVFFDWRLALIGAITIPLSVVAATLALHLWGVTMNAMILAGLVIALAVIIDDTIVGVDRITQRLRQDQPDGADARAASIARAILDVFGPVFYATLIMLAAMVPIFAIGYAGGLDGAFIRPLALACVVALLASLAVALTVTPALALVMLRGRGLRRSPVAARIVRSYDAALTGTARRPWLMLTGFTLVLLAGFLTFPALDLTMDPRFREQTLVIQWQAVSGTSHPEMQRISARVAAELRTVPGVTFVGSHIGRAESSDQIVNINSGELWVAIDKRAGYDRTVAAVQQIVAGYPGIDHDELTYVEQQMSDVRRAMTERDEVVVRVFGQDLAALDGKAEEIRQAMAGIDGVSAARIDRQPVEPQVEIQVDLAKAQAYGLKPGDVRRAAAALVSGILVGSLFEQQKVFDVIVWGIPETRHDLTAIKNLRIDTPSGGQVRLGDVASVHVAPVPTVIRHDAVSRFADVHIVVSGRDINAVADDVEERLAGITLPREYHTDVFTPRADRLATERQFFRFGIAAVIAIYLLLQACFASWRMATLAALSLPVGLGGGLFAVAATGGDVSIGSLLGFLALAGINARFLILLFRTYARLGAANESLTGLDLVREGTRERVVPIVAAALATALAFTPLLIMGRGPGHELLHPMAVVIVGGLVTTLLMNLFVVPFLYARFAPSPGTARVVGYPLPTSPAAGGIAD